MTPELRDPKPPRRAGAFSRLSFLSKTALAGGIALVGAWSVALPAGVDADAQRATALFRICQEALTNVARHAAASRVQVELRAEDGRLELCVADDGRGMALEGEPGIGVSLGMLGMRERAAALGGEVRFTSAPGRGTTVTVRLPAG